MSSVVSVSPRKDKTINSQNKSERQKLFIKWFLEAIYKMVLFNKSNMPPILVNKHHTMEIEEHVNE